MSPAASNVRSQAAATLSEVLEHGRSVDSCVEGVRSRLGPRDLRLFRELVSGTIRWLKFVDLVIERAADRPLENIDPTLRDHLRLGVYQILFLDRVPARAAVHEAVELAKAAAGTSGSRIGAGRFVNAVLRLVARTPQRADWTVHGDDPIADLAANHSHPLALVRGWVERFGVEETRTLLEINNRPKSGLGVMAADRRAVAGRLRAGGAVVEESMLSPLGLVVRGLDPQEVVDAGGYVQDEASQAAALVPAPDMGEWVFDAAASPGGKSLALAAAASEIRIFAGDLRVDRLPRLAANVRSLGGGRIHVLAADALAPTLVPETFDRVLFDAPCSGTGTLRKHPELKWRVNPDEIRRLADLQLAGLRSLAPLVAATGRLCYLTCSIEVEENEDVVDAFLTLNSDWYLEELGSQPELAEFATASGGWQVLPAGEHDGATAHVLRRR